MNTASKTRHVFILFLADIVWGIAFVAQSKGGDAVGAFSFNGIRFLIGALCLLPVIKILDKKELTVNRPENKKQKKELWIAGSCCGIALFFASNLQQLGISMGAESGKCERRGNRGAGVAAIRRFAGKGHHAAQAAIASRRTHQ